MLVTIIIIVTDEDPSLRIESFAAIINLCVVSTKLNWYCIHANVQGTCCHHFFLQNSVEVPIFSELKFPSNIFKQKFSNRFFCSNLNPVMFVQQYFPSCPACG